MVGIRDVARKAGVSPGTVSRVLNNDPTMVVSVATKEKIMQVVKELNYNLVDKKYAKKAVPSILVITTVSQNAENADTYFTEIMSGMTTEARRLHLAMNRIYDLVEAPKAWQDFDQVGAIIVVGTLTDRELKRLTHLNHNLIVVDKASIPEIDADLVNANLERATHQLLEDFWQAGHRQIAFIGGVTLDLEESGTGFVTDNEKRLLSYLAFCNQRGLEPIVKLGDWTEAAGEELFAELLAESQPDIPTALLIASDQLALGVYRGIAKTEFEIGKDLFLASFDDSPEISDLSPTLTSVKLPSYELGKAAIRLAKERIFQEREVALHLSLATKINYRESLPEPQ